MKNKKIICAILLGLLTCCVVFAAGCRREEPSDGAVQQGKEASLQIGISFDSFVIERWIRDRDVFVSTANELGAEVNVQNANGDVDRQIEQIRYLIQKKVDVINIIAIDGDKLQDVVQEAKAAGIKVVCYDRLIRGAATDLYISFDNEMVGRQMGEALAEALPDGGKIYAIYGSRSDDNVTMVKKGLTEALAGTGVEIVYENYCEKWLAELAFDYVGEALEQFPDVDGIMCGNDDLASQAIRALAEQRLAGKIPVVAQDAELAACQRIAEGTQTMTVYKSVDEEARAAAILSVALGRGEDITAGDAGLQVNGTIDDGLTEIPYYEIDPIPVNFSNLGKIIIDSGFHRAEDVYLNVAETESEH